ncbi:MAG: hypothetical protein U1E59_02175 [Amaricoccus sp.]
MAIVFPLARSVFADRLKIAAFRWQLQPFVESSGTGLGQVITNEISPRRWRAEVELARMPHADAADIQALVDAIGPSGTFYLHNPAQLGPRDDPTGSAVTGYAVAINATSDNKVLKLSGLPAGYTLRRGDMLHFDYGPSPTRRALHRIVEDATANGSGTTGFFEVRPFLKAGTTTGLLVTLVRPAARMMLEPGSFNPGTEGPVNTAGMSFTAIEVR